MCCPRRQVALQAQRVLEHLHTLHDHYHDALAEADSELAEALHRAMDALERFVQEPTEG